MSASLSLIVARARNGVIGRDGAIPWRLSTDLRRFKTRTMGKPVVMGHKTWESFPQRPLPGRANLVLSRDPEFRAEGGWTFSALDAALAAARAMTREEIFIVGGAALYGETLAIADRLYLTEVDAAPEGDVRLPAFDEARFRETAREAFPAGPRDAHAFVIRTLERVSTPL
jgi:dihydrofolate reductase